MNNISKVRFTNLRFSKYLRAFKIIYEKGDIKKPFEICDCCDSISAIIYNVSRNVLVFVTQFRAGLYTTHIVKGEGKLKDLNEKQLKKYPGDLGLALELCAGIQDKNMPMVQIAQEEILEETGYNVPLENLECVHVYNASVDISSNLIYTYYCEVTDEMRVSEGGGIDNEVIEVVEMTPEDWIEFMKKPHLPTNGSFIVGYYWFFANKYKKKLK